MYRLRKISAISALVLAIGFAAWILIPTPECADHSPATFLIDEELSFSFTYPDRFCHNDPKDNNLYSWSWPNVLVRYGTPDLDSIWGNLYLEPYFFKQRLRKTLGLSYAAPLLEFISYQGYGEVYERELRGESGILFLLTLGAETLEEGVNEQGVNFIIAQHTLRPSAEGSDRYLEYVEATSTVTGVIFYTEEPKRVVQVRFISDRLSADERSTLINSFTFTE